MRLSSVAAVALCLLAGACAAEPTDDLTPATRGGGRDGAGAGAPTTGATLAPKATSEATRKAVNEMESCPSASGTSPATFDGTRGSYAAYIAEFIAADIPLSFDVVQWMTGEPARLAYQEDHPGESEGPPNDYYIRNASSQIRQADVSADARVWLVKMVEDENADVDRATFEELGSHNENSEGSSSHLYWLTFENHRIVDICEQFRP